MDYTGHKTFEDSLTNMQKATKILNSQNFYSDDEDEKNEFDLINNTYLTDNKSMKQVRI